MGMFDELTVKYPLPLAGANDLLYQTKDTPNQFMDHYEIREDGTLWVETYDTEDRSDLAKWKAEHPGQEPPEEMKGPLSSIIGMMTRVNKRWEHVPFTGQLRFYKLLGDDHSGWIEWAATFVNGTLKQLPMLELIENTQPKGKT